MNGKKFLLLLTGGSTPLSLAATLSGVGSCVGTLAVAASLSATLSGSGTLSATPKVAVSLSATLTGSGSCFGTPSLGQASVSLAATLSGSGTLSATLSVGLPYGLPDAVVALFDASPTLSGDGAFSKIYESQAGDRPTLPYLVFTIERGSLIRKTSSSAWHDDRVTLRAWAATQGQANTLADAVRGVFEPAGNGVNLAFQVGGTAPLYEVDRSQGKAPGRAPGQAYQFWAEVEYSARTREGSL